ncbi:MAG TPA: bifunctional phosphopantothenoylcysteine decarboxylase/phosphopantothenate--cysteine ligase CoaBC [Burkholderiaceae bacterium]|jgi:phosphopantothenoylcysteine decarboxylase/phosphopantothenate--cysteine ligase|nr:bifunctional phosphopantothenoylcysteine decarboxylase/phosphopantothenate--cysteine ligase CoaBC [Burkholderiaceae bacterium]
MELKGKRILVGMTGGIAAYKTCELVRRMKDEGADVQVAMSQGARQFVTTTTMQALSGKPVFEDQWDGRMPNAMPHIDLTRGTDAILVAPASAHFLAKLANGLCDDLLSTVAVARACPLLVAPAMNVEMWNHLATQRNVQTLRADGIEILGPAAGDQACGEVGLGRMLEPHELLQSLIAFFQPKLLAGKHVLLTAGPTFEPIDPVRGITNLSSGKMGFALARAAREAGAQVTLVAGPTTLATPLGVRRVDVRTAQEMYEAVLAYVEPAQVFVAVAAVADWRVANPSASKIKKGVEAAAPSLTFIANPDILASVASRPRPPFCVGFAAESDNVLEHAKTKRAAKNVPLIVANRAQDVFGRDESELLLVDDKGAMTLPRDAKLAQARRLITEIARRLP